MTVSNMVEADIEKVLFSAEAVQRRVKEMAQELELQLGKSDDAICVLCVLDGAFVFCADLIRHLPLNFKIGFIKAASYGERTETSGSVLLKLDVPNERVKGHTIVIVEDIIDTGRTLEKIIEHLKSKGAAKVLTAVLLDKAARRERSISIDHVGFDCPDEFVVGYGLDYGYKYRQLPYIGCLTSEAIKSNGSDEETAV
eukprot:Clim_evm76s134 gene=Clim_evmTU76s134